MTDSSAIQIGIFNLNHTVTVIQKIYTIGVTDIITMTISNNYFFAYTDGMDSNGETVQDLQVKYFEEVLVCLLSEYSLDPNIYKKECMCT